MSAVSHRTVLMLRAFRPPHFTRGYGARERFDEMIHEGRHLPGPVIDSRVLSTER